MDVDARLEALEAENERLRDEIDRLKRAFGIDGFLAPLEFRLTGKEGAVLGVLMRRESATKAQIMDGIYGMGPDDEPGIKIVDVFVCKMRKKIAPYGVMIETLWGRGYSMTLESKAKVLALAPGAHQPEPADEIPELPALDRLRRGGVAA